MWILEYEAKPNERVNRYFIWATMLCGKEPKLWCSRKDNKWKTLEECKVENAGASSTSNKRIKTIKAFLRYLNKHPELKGYKVTLVNRYAGLDVHATWKD